ncbi:hypothetical protein J7J18_04865 [bacterium]|nr:hypothetical protein [bacterium]
MTVFPHEMKHKHIPENKIYELEEKVFLLYNLFYKYNWNYCDLRTVEQRSWSKDKCRRPKLCVRIGQACLIAGFKRGDNVFVRVQGRDIIIRKDQYGCLFKIGGNYYGTNIVLSPILLALGYKKGDWVIVLAKRDEIRIRDAITEFKKLDKYLKKVKEMGILTI